jgi:hypothetical protein
MARRKRIDPKAAKAAKQKKIAIGGGLLFVALLIFSVPKTMKMMHPHHAVQPVQHTTTAPATSPTTPTSATSPTSPTSLPVSSATATPVLTAELAPAAREGQLAVLSASFKTKDPFKQLIDESAPTAATPATTQPAETAKTPAAAKPASEVKAVPAAKPAAAPAPVAAPATPEVTQPAVQKVVLPLLSAVISVNRTRSGVGLKQDFPAKAPLFHLLKLTEKTAKISVAGGTMAGGGKTLTLRRGTPLTLVNTADGTRFRLVLLSTSTKAVAAKPAPATVTPTQTKPADTTAAGTTPTETTSTSTTTTTSTSGSQTQPADTIAVPALGG